MAAGAGCRAHGILGQNPRQLGYDGCAAPLLPVPFPGAVGRAFKDGANLCPEQSSRGLTWTQYLEASHSPEGAVR